MLWIITLRYKVKYVWPTENGYIDDDNHDDDTDSGDDSGKMNNIVDLEIQRF